MGKTVGLVGHCGPDGGYLRISLASIDRSAKIVFADDDESLRKLLSDGVDVLLLNRVLDYGFDEHEGVEVIRKLHKHYPNVKFVLVSNYPDAQAAAVAAGALPGFGKRELGSARVKEMLKELLSAETKEVG